MFEKKLECDQYTVMIGLMKVSSNLLGEDAANMGLILVKERLMERMLNFNNYIREIWDTAERARALDNKCSISQKFTSFFGFNKDSGAEKAEKDYPHCHVVPNSKAGSSQSGPSSDSTSESSDSHSLEGFSKKKRTVGVIKNLHRNEFFVYSASLSFNPNIKTAAELLSLSSEGGVVFTITAKMPTLERQRKTYLMLLVKYFGSGAVLLNVKRESSCLESILSKTKVAKDSSPEAAVLKPIPKYFDEDYSDEEPDSRFGKAPDAANAYSFFRHSSYLLSKYATSNLVMRDDDKYVNQRLLQVKLQRGKNGLT